MSADDLIPTRNALPHEARSTSVALLNAALADLTDLQSQAKQAHWNVRGKRFYPLHKLFDEIAESVGRPLDEIAERAVQLGGIAKGTLRQAAAASRLEEFPAFPLDEQSVLSALTVRVAWAANSIREAIDAASQAGDADTADLFTEVSQILDKNLWMLEASQ